jgi:hypothetical protein
MDSAFDAGERARIRQLVQDRFGLGAEEAIDLVGEAERVAAASVEWHGFTRAIKDGFDHAEPALRDRPRERRGAQARARPPRPAITPRLGTGSISLVSAVRRSYFDSLSEVASGGLGDSTCP